MNYNRVSMIRDTILTGGKALGTWNQFIEAMKWVPGINHQVTSRKGKTWVIEIHRKNRVVNLELVYPIGKRK